MSFKELLPNGLALQLTVKKTPHIDEWVARVTEDQKLTASYFAEDKEDAVQTGKLMFADILQKKIERV